VQTFFKSAPKVALALFLIGQALAAAHAIEHGIAPHEHNGVVCLTALNDEREDFFPPKQSLDLALVPVVSKLSSFSLQVLFAKNLAPKPPSTGPPSI